MRGFDVYTIVVLVLKNGCQVTFPVGSPKWPVLQYHHWQLNWEACDYTLWQRYGGRTTALAVIPYKSQLGLAISQAWR